MIDMHYDLLTICYVCYLKNNYTKIEDIAKQINNNNGNIEAIFANLYFMSKEEMIDELDNNYFRDNVSVIEMFKISKQILEHYLPNVNFVYSIEGCDYINEHDLIELYDLGLRSIVLVWNNENIYGSGNRTQKGLTKAGISFLNQAINLGMGIDLSHANEETFYGMIEVIKENQKMGRYVVCYASHSNSRKLCNRNRNLSDNQLKQIKKINGLVGLFSNRNFVTLNKNITKEQQELEYLKHIEYVGSIVGMDNVALSTDDMSFYKEYDVEYLELPIFEYSNIYNSTKNLLDKYYSDDIVYNIMSGNVFSKIINKLNQEKLKNNR